jgi:hypothetical protein
MFYMVDDIGQKVCHALRIVFTVKYNTSFFVITNTYSSSPLHCLYPQAFFQVCNIYPSNT